MTRAGSGRARQRARSRTPRSPPSPPRRSSAKCTRWSPASRREASAAAEAAAKIAGVEKVLLADDAGLRARAARERRAARRAADGRLRRVRRARHHHRQEHRPARRRAARRDADLAKSSAIEGDGPSPARSTPATPSPRSKARDAKLVMTVRGTAFDKAAAEGGSAAIEAVSGPGDAGLSSFVGARARQERAARADQRQDHRLGRPRAQGRGDLRAADRAARRQARRRGRREPRGGRRGLYPQRLPGRPDRQDRRPRSSTSRSASRARSSTSPG